MTKDQIERTVARKFATLDAFYDGEEHSPQAQAECNAAIAAITQWAERQYALLALSGEGWPK